MIPVIIRMKALAEKRVELSTSAHEMIHAMRTEKAIGMKCHQPTAGKMD
jgi:hypothetical protein